MGLHSPKWPCAPSPEQAWGGRWSGSPWAGASLDQGYTQVRKAPAGQPEPLSPAPGTRWVVSKHTGWRSGLPGWGDPRARRPLGRGMANSTQPHRPQPPPSPSPALPTPSPACPPPDWLHLRPLKPRWGALQAWWGLPLQRAWRAGTSRDREAQRQGGLLGKSGELGLPGGSEPSPATIRLASQEAEHTGPGTDGCNLQGSGVTEAPQMGKGAAIRAGPPLPPSPRALPVFSTRNPPVAAGGRRGTWSRQACV